MSYAGNASQQFRRICVLGIILAILGSPLIGCQADTGSSNRLTRSSVSSVQAAGDGTDAFVTATPMPTFAPPKPSATLSRVASIPPKAPEPLGTPAAPRGELDAATKVIPILKVALPKGPRKLPPNRLLIPSIGIDAKVIELGTHYNDEGELVWDTAAYSVGHHTGTANPGELGNVVLSGHISSTREGAVFKRLPEIEVGAGIVVGTNDRKYLYQVVDKKTVEPTQIDVMNSTSEEILTLITCVPDGVYTHRLIVTARRI